MVCARAGGARRPRAARNGPGAGGAAQPLRIDGDHRRLALSDHGHVAAALEPLALQQYARWGMPINEKKRPVEGKFGHLIAWVGVEHDLDTDAHRVHADKRAKWSAAVKAIRRVGKCSPAELRAVLGKLSFASEVLTWGRAFLGHLGDVLARAGTTNSQVVRMSAGALRESAAWERLLRRAPPSPSLTRPVARVARRYISDASTSVGLAGARLDGDTLRIWHYVYTDGERAHIAASSRSSDGAHIARLECVCFLISAQRWREVGSSPDYLEFAGDDAASCAMLRAKTARADKTREILLGRYHLHSCESDGIRGLSPGRAQRLLDLASRTDSTDSLRTTLTHAFPNSSWRSRPCSRPRWNASKGYARAARRQLGSEVALRGSALSPRR